MCTLIIIDLGENHVGAIAFLWPWKLAAESALWNTNHLICETTVAEKGEAVR